LRPCVPIEPFPTPVTRRDPAPARRRALDYRLIKQVWAFNDNRIAVRFAYEWHDDAGNWFRSYGNENWEFDDNGLMRMRFASINDLPIRAEQRLFHWPLGPRPEGHQGLSELAL
jgi:nuclear transport factor 2 (NTF2) superfamily protein